MGYYPWCTLWCNTSLEVSQENYAVIFEAEKIQ